MEGYLRANQQAYEELAEEFQVKRPKRLAETQNTVGYFLNSLRPTTPTAHPKVLELGPGSGEVARLLSEAGCSVTAIEFSPRMAELAQTVAPSAKIVNAEFLKYDFQEKYDGIFAIAFIHLFSPQDCAKVLEKIQSLMKPDAVAMISTTRHSQDSSGFSVKGNFALGKSPRWRQKFSKTGFLNILQSYFELLEYNEKQSAEVNGKVWMEALVRTNKNNPASG